MPETLRIEYRVAIGEFGALAANGVSGFHLAPAGRIDLNAQVGDAQLFARTRQITDSACSNGLAHHVHVGTPEHCGECQHAPDESLRVLPHVLRAY
jgi:hypothetical protein